MVRPLNSESQICPPDSESQNLPFFCTASQLQEVADLTSATTPLQRLEVLLDIAAQMRQEVEERREKVCPSPILKFRNVTPFTFRAQQELTREDLERHGSALYYALTGKTGQEPLFVEKNGRPKPNASMQPLEAYPAPCQSPIGRGVSDFQKPYGSPKQCKSGSPLGGGVEAGGHQGDDPGDEEGGERRPGGGGRGIRTDPGACRLSNEEQEVDCSHPGVPHWRGFSEFQNLFLFL